MMKKVIFITLLVFGLFSLTKVVSADTKVHVRIETENRTVYDKDVAVPNGCTVKDSDSKENKIDGPKAICALDAASKDGNFSYEFKNSSGLGLFLNKIDNDQGSASKYWLYRVNFKLPPVGMSAYDLNSNDNLLVSFGSSPLTPLKVNADKNDLLVGQDLKIATLLWDDDENIFKNFGGVNVRFGDKTYLSVDGQITIFSPKAGTYTITAEKDNYVRSEKIQVKVTEPTTPTPTVTLTSSPTPTPTSTVTVTLTPTPTPSGQVAGSSSSKLPNSGPGENLAILLLCLLSGFYLRSKVRII